MNAARVALLVLTPMVLGAVGACGSDYNRERYADASGALVMAGLFCAIDCRDPDYVVLRGRVLQETTFTRQPVAHTRLALQQSGHEVASTTTDRNGRFAFTQNLADGTYDLVLDSARHVGASRVVLEGQAVTVEVIAVQK